MFGTSCVVLAWHCASFSRDTGTEKLLVGKRHVLVTDAFGFRYAIALMQTLPAFEPLYIYKFTFCGPPQWFLKVNLLFPD